MKLEISVKRDDWAKVKFATTTSSSSAAAAAPAASAASSSPAAPAASAASPSLLYDYDFSTIINYNRNHQISPSSD